MSLVYYAIQQLVNALSIGSLYALMAVGLAMVFGILRLINFSHGDMMMVAAYIAAFALFAQLPFALAVILMVGGTVLLGLLIERVAYRPIRGAPEVAALLTSFAVGQILQNGTLLWTRLAGRPVQIAFPAPEVLNGVLVFGPITVPRLNVVSLVAGVALLVLLSLFVTRTTLGLSMRAAAEDLTAARLMGININRVVASAFAIGAGLASIAGLLFAVQAGRQDVADAGQRGEHHLQRAKRVAAHHGPSNAAEPADHRRNKRLEHRRKADVWVDLTGLHREQQPGHRRKPSPDRERRRDHPVDVDPHQPSGVEILGGGAHGKAQRGARDKQREQHEQHHPGRQADDVEPRNGDRAEREHAAQHRRRGKRDLVGPADPPHRQQRAVLQDLADRERRQQQRNVGRAAQRAVGHALHQQAGPNRSRNHHGNGQPQRQACEQGERSKVGGDHHHIAVSEVDQPQNAEHHRQPDSHQGVEAADTQRVDDLLDEVIDQTHGFCFAYKATYMSHPPLFWACGSLVYLLFRGSLFARSAKSEP
jgi:branched-chain amino acid transport system permease protein